MTKDYKQYKLDLKRSPVDERDYIAETIYSAEGELPEELDLRDDLPPVFDQKSQGSCAACTAACMKEWQENQDVGLEEHMSVQFVYNNRSNAPGEGMYPRDVMAILNKIGIVKETDYPYFTDAPITNALKEKAADYKIKGYASVSTIDGLKKALVKNGPCFISFPVYDYGLAFWKPKQGSKLLGYHAVTVVGYDKDGFIIRNSWSPGWGLDGYTNYGYRDWGSHREIWTTIDEDSDKPLPPPKPKKKEGWFKRFVKKVFG